MDEGVPREDELAALRRRLYRPAPPAGAVDEYLTALSRGTATTAVSPEAPSEARPTGQRSIWLIAVPVAALAAAAALLAAPSTAPPADEALPQPAAPGVFVGAMAGSGARTAVFDAFDRWAVLTVLCSGRGTVTVRLGGDAPSVQTCGSDTPSLGMTGSRTRVGRVPVSVSTTGNPRWSLAVGAIGGAP